MFISKAYAQAVESLSELEGEIPPLPPEQSPMDLLLTNLMVLGVLIFLFYILLILPQQRRFKEHAKMLNELKKGDQVVTGGGLIGRVEKVIQDKDEIIIDLGNGLKVTALRSTIHEKDDPRLRQKASNDKEPPLKDKKEDTKADADKAADGKEEKKTAEKK